MEFLLRVGEETTITDPRTGEPITVRMVAGEDGKPTVIVEAAPDGSIRVKAPGVVEVIYKDPRALH